MVIEYSTGRVLLARLPHQADLIESLQSICQEKGLRMAFFSVIGALSQVTLAYYDQDKKDYSNKCLEGGYEIVACTGNISLREERPFVHAHLVVSDGGGQALAGHLMSPSILFAGEAFILELKGEELTRRYDSVTGLHLWQLD